MSFYEEIMGIAEAERRRYTPTGIAFLIQLYIDGQTDRAAILATADQAYAGDIGEMLDKLDAIGGAHGRAGQERCLAAWLRLASGGERAARSDVLPDLSGEQLRSLMLGWMP